MTINDILATHDVNADLFAATIEDCWEEACEAMTSDEIATAIESGEIGGAEMRARACFLLTGQTVWP